MKINVNTDHVSKIYSSRDSATAVLKKLGIEKKDYSMFIEKKDGKFICYTEKAKLYLVGSKPAAPAPAVSDTVTVKKLKKAGIKRVTVSSMARDMILRGKTNEQVWDALKSNFKLDDSKKHYPGWYRAALKRSGELK